jgi:hypothetical protein
METALLLHLMFRVFLTEVGIYLHAEVFEIHMTAEPTLVFAVMLG